MIQSGYKQMAGDVCETDSERLTRCACSVTLTTAHRCQCRSYERRPLCSCPIPAELTHRPVNVVPCRLHSNDISPVQVCTKVQYSDLLGRTADEENCQNHQHHQQQQQKIIDEPQKSSQPRSEFNFTLYDFEGHGSVTKDDIAGLVRAIYDVVGARVHVPPSGSKTINVKLTVCPETTTEHSAPSPKQQQSKTETQTATPGFDTVTCSMDTDDVKLESKVNSAAKDGSTVQTRNRTTAGVANQRRRNAHVRHLVADSVNTPSTSRSNTDVTSTQSGCRPEARIPSPYSLPDSQRQDYELLNRCAQFSVRAANNQNTRNVHQQHRHRHRERENYRAMRQVIEWLEREHVQTQPNTPQKSPTRHRHTHSHGDGPNETTACGGIEYRHVHEHVHHHYHHINSLTEAVVL